MFDEETVVTEGEVDFFDTGSVPVPPAEPDAHRGTIEGVTIETFESGSTAIRVGLRSIDIPTLDTYQRLFPPKMFVADIYVDKSTLPAEEGNNQLFSYRTNIKNDDGTGAVQQLVELAKKAGRSPEGQGLVRAKNFEQYVDNLNKLLIGLEVVFVRRPGKEQYKNRLEVKKVYGSDVIDTPGKKFKGVRCLWLGQ